MAHSGAHVDSPTDQMLHYTLFCLCSTRSSRPGCSTTHLSPALRWCACSCSSLPSCRWGTRRTSALSWPTYMWCVQHILCYRVVDREAFPPDKREDGRLARAFYIYMLFFALCRGHSPTRSGNLLAPACFYSRFKARMKTHCSAVSAHSISATFRQPAGERRAQPHPYRLAHHGAKRRRLPRAQGRGLLRVHRQRVPPDSREVAAPMGRLLHHSGRCGPRKYLDRPRCALYPCCPWLCRVLLHILSRQRSTRSQERESRKRR